jgi:hypothetical protein
MKEAQTMDATLSLSGKQVEDKESRNPATIAQVLRAQRDMNVKRKSEAPNVNALKNRVFDMILQPDRGGGEFVLTRDARTARLKREQDASRAAESNRVVGEIQYKPGMWGGGQSADGSKPSREHTGLSGDRHRLASMKVQAISGTCTDLADATKSNACPPDMVAKAVKGTWEKAKNDKQFAFDVCCESESAVTEDEKKEGITNVSERFFKSASAKEAAVYRFLKRVELDMEAINSYFDKFGPAIQNKFNEEPELKARFVKGMENLKFVWKVVSTELTFCSQKLQQAQKTAADFSYAEARSDLAFSGCAPEFVDTVYVSAKVLYFRRLREITSLMKKVVANYDYEYYEKEREQIGTSDSSTASKWLGLLSNNIRESFSSTWAFVKYQTSGLGAKVMILFMASIFAVLVLISLGPASVLAALAAAPGVQLAAAATSLGMSVVTAAGSAISAVTATVYAGIVATFPTWLLPLIQLMPGLIWMMQRLSLMSKIMETMKTQIMNYASGTGHVYQGLRNVFDKFGVLESQKVKFRSAVLTADADEIVGMDDKFYAAIEQRAKTPQLGVVMSGFAKILNMFIGVMNSSIVKSVLWFASLGNDLINGSYRVIGKGMAVAAAAASAASNALGTDFGLSTAVTAATVVLGKIVNQKELFAVADMEQLSKELTDAKQQIGGLVDGLTFDNVVEVSKQTLIGKLRNNLPSVVVEAIFDTKTSGEDKLYVPMSMWTLADSVTTESSIAYRKILAEQQIFKATHDNIKAKFGDDSTSIKQFIVRGLWGFSPEEIREAARDAEEGGTLLVKGKAIMWNYSMAKADQSYWEAAKSAIGVQPSEEAAKAVAKQKWITEKAEEIMKNITSGLPNPMNEAEMKTYVDSATKVGETAAETSYFIFEPEDGANLGSETKGEFMARQWKEVSDNKFSDNVMKEHVQMLQREGLINKVYRVYNEITAKFSEAGKLVDFENGAFDAAVGNEPKDIQEKIAAARAATGMEGATRIVLPTNFAALSQEELTKAFQAETQRSQAALMDDYTLQGAAKTVKIKVKDFASAAQEAAVDGIKRITGAETMDMSTWSMENWLWLVGTIVLFLSTITALHFFTSMGVQEVFDKKELEDSKIKELLKQHGEEIEKSLSMFGRIRRAPNAAAVYQRARAVEGKSSEAALQAVAATLAYHCPPGDKECTQPDVNTFDLGTIKLIPDKSVGTVSRPQQEDMMVQKILQRMERG